MATTDEINKPIQKEITSLQEFVHLPTPSLASMPKTNYSPTVSLPDNSLLLELSAIREAVHAQGLSTNTPQTLTEKRNARWRGAADYDNLAVPLYLYLENVNWEKVVEQHANYWYQAFVRSLYFLRQEGY
jgi:hypothetical protein